MPETSVQKKKRKDEDSRKGRRLSFQEVGPGHSSEEVR